jgi:hypothetical protein
VAGPISASGPRKHEQKLEKERSFGRQINWQNLPVVTLGKIGAGDRPSLLNLGGDRQMANHLRTTEKITSRYSITRIVPAPTELVSVERHATHQALASVELIREGCDR